MLDACTARTLRGMHIRSDRGILNILSGFGHHTYLRSIVSQGSCLIGAAIVST